MHMTLNPLDRPLIPYSPSRFGLTVAPEVLGGKVEVCANA